MLARPGPLLAAAVFLSGCVSVEPPQPKMVTYGSADAKALAPMLQSLDAGPLRVSSVVYKPAVLPLVGFLKKLSRGELKPAFASVHFRYKPSNVDDEALRLLIKHGYVPVFVSVKNAGPAPADARALRLALRDASLSLAPIPNEDLPRELRCTDPKAVLADTYNVGATVVGVATLLGGIIALAALAHYNGPSSVPADDRRSSGSGGSGSGPSVNNDILYPIRVDTPVDYNGLLFRPGELKPGETTSGLLFFKARGADWTGLRLTASLSA